MLVFTTFGPVPATVSSSEQQYHVVGLGTCGGGIFWGGLVDGLAGPCLVLMHGLVHEWVHGGAFRRT